MTRSAPGSKERLARFWVPVLITLTGGFAAAASAEAKPIAAYPSPGTGFASPEGNISFNGVTAGTLGRIVVRGSRTGLHPGRLRNFGGPVGVAFIPARPFASRERVTVTAARHTFFGTGGRRSFSFRTGEFLPERDGKPPVSPARGQTPGAWETFRTLRLRIPKLTIHQSRPGKASGKIFYAPRTSGPTIRDEEGELVWYRPGLRITDFRAQRYRGRNVLTWWRRDTFGGKVQSRFEIADSRYRVIRRFEGGNGFIGDPHEFNLTPRGTAYVTAYRTAVVDMSRFGGPKRGFLLDYIAQEIDLQTGLVVWEWHPLGNLRLNETYLGIPKRNTRPFDWLHLNSINDDKDGNILLSARHTQALYKINRKTGKVMWRIGGKRSSFRLGRGVRFGFQHDVQRQPNGTLTIFDNGAGGVHGRVNRFSSAKTLRFDGRTRTVKLVRAYRSPRKNISNSQGNTQRQANGNLFVGWGSVNSCTEFASDGRILFDFSFSAKTVSYRCFKAPWTGAPRTPIAVLSKPAGVDSRVWVSWNGDTRVRTWRVLAGGATLAYAGEAPRDGFETVVPVTGQPARFRLVGLDANGKVLGRSKINQLGKLTR
ncbi:MAG: Aryl-sulfate sulfotransferase [Actinomycetota bacterium]|nr:Aryl-sulfate sulfotransferase [Actinomycetota bacterium]